VDLLGQFVTQRTTSPVWTVGVVDWPLLESEVPPLPESELAPLLESLAPLLDPALATLMWMPLVPSFIRAED